MIHYIINQIFSTKEGAGPPAPPPGSAYAEEEVLPHSFGFLFPFLDRPVESACCYGKPVRVLGADEVVIIGVINVGFAIDSTGMIP